MEVLEKCLCCGGTDFKIYLRAMDNYSTEEFDIVRCTSCGFIFTNPRPVIHEIGKYYSSPDYMSHHSHSSGWVPRIYRFARRYMMGKKLKLIRQVAGRDKDFDLLDFGCGTGDFLKFIRRQAIRAEGVEPDEQAREAAKWINGLEVFSLESSQQLAAESFDVITLWHVLEHVHELHAQIEAFNRWLRKGGKLIVAVPNIESYDARKYGRYWDALDVPRHIYHFSPKNIQQIVAQYGFEPDRQYPLFLDAYYVSMRSEWHRGTARWMSYFKAIFTGWKSNCKAAKSGNYSSLIYVFTKNKTLP